MKKITTLLVAFVLVFLSTGCEKKNTPTSSAGGGNNGPIILQLWTTEGADFFESLGREFIASIGAGGVRFEVVEFTNASELQLFLMDGLAEGKGPDLVYMNGDFIAGNRMKFVPAVGEEPIVDRATFEAKFVKAAQEVFLDESGLVYGVPMGVDSLALVYNQGHVSDRLPDRNTPSENWADLKKDVEHLTKEDNSFERFTVSGAALGRVDNITYGYDILENIMLQLGVNFFDTTGNQALFHITKAPVDGRTKNLGEEALDFFTSFADARFKNYSWNEFLAPSNSVYKDFEAFARGKTSMVFAKSGDVELIKKLAQELKEKKQNYVPQNDIRVTFLPQAIDPELNPNRKTVGYVSGLVVAKNTAYPNTAWDFLVFAAGKDNLAAFHEATQLPTPRVDLILEQEVEPDLGVYARQAKYARANIFPLDKLLFKEGIKPLILRLNQRLIKPEKALNALGDSFNEKLKNKQARQRQIQR